MIAPALSANALHVIGDIHWGAISQFRLAALAADLAAGYEGVAPAARIQVGDMTQRSTVEQMQNSIAWMDANMPAVSGTLPNARNWVSIAGNHDIVETAYSGDPEVETTTKYDYHGGQGDWYDEFGLPDAYAVDLPEPRRLICLSWVLTQRLTSDQMTFLEAQALAAPGKVTLVVHPPPYGTVDGISKGKRFCYSSYDASVHVNGPGGSNSSELFALLAALPNVDSVLSGHSHSPFTAPDIVCTRELGGRDVLMVNAGAPYEDFQTTRNYTPIRTMYVDRIDGGFVVSPRDATRKNWMGFRQGYGSEFWEVD